MVEFLEAFEKIDEGGLFYQILLQELEFLGDRVLVGMKHKNANVIKEVTSATRFLENIASRRVGEEVPLFFNGTYCCFAIVIMGKKLNMTPSGEVYVNHIRKRLIPKGIDTLYILGVKGNQDVINNVCSEIDDTFEQYRSYSAPVNLTYQDSAGERTERRQQYLAILRKKGISPIYRAAS